MKTSHKLGVVIGLLGLGASAASAQVAAPATASPTSAPAATSPAPVRPVDDIVKLADAKVSKEVMLSFVASSTKFFNLSATDIITLKEKGVADEVLSALLKRDADMKTSVAQSYATTAAPAIVRRLSTEGAIDPESYDFWFYHYAYPRALSESYRMLAPYDPALARRRDYPGPVMGFSANALVLGPTAPMQSRSTAAPANRNRR